VRSGEWVGYARFGGVAARALGDRDERFRRLPLHAERVRCSSAGEQLDQYGNRDAGIIDLSERVRHAAADRGVGIVAPPTDEVGVPRRADPAERADETILRRVAGTD